MDEKEQRRPGRPGGSAVTRERPANPRRRPQGARPRTGTASEQAQARRERLAAKQNEPEAPVRARRERPAARQAGSEEPIRTVSRSRSAADRAAEHGRITALGREPEQPEEAEAPVRRRREPAKKKKARKKKPHRVYNTNFGYKFLTMLAVVGVIVVAMIIFFKVKHIQVVRMGVDDPDAAAAGSEVLDENGQPVRSYYTPEEIIAASGINIDDNLLGLSKAAIASRIHATLPYVNEIQIRKRLPDTVIITVSEFTVTYGIQDERGGWWLISREGRVLDATDEHGVKNHTIVSGMPIEVPEVGDYIKPTATEGADLSEIAAKRTACLTVLPLLENAPFAKQIINVDLSTSYDIVLWYGTQFEIRLGNTENLSYKLEYLQAVLTQLGRDKSGTIDLTFTEDNGAHFLPFR